MVNTPLILLFLSLGCSMPPVPNEDSARLELPRAAKISSETRTEEEKLWHEPMAEGTPATKASAKLLATLVGVEEGLKSTKYQHFTRVNSKQGIFYWDCSGMAGWVLGKAAPMARSALRGKRPLARDFYNTISRSPNDGQRRGWSQINGPEEIRPGDVYAWLKPHIFRNRKNTGHVGFVVGTPQPHRHHVNVWVMQIADATRILHENDSRPRGGEGGYGTATMAFLFHGNGAPIAYGWYGSRQGPESFVRTKIAFGRVHR